MAELGLFEGYGIELEYMLVDRDTLRVAAICDRVLAIAAGEPTASIEDGPIAWSNELALHVIEVKTNGPVDALTVELADAFVADLRRIDAIAAQLGARLLPTAMHPTMDPGTQTKLWPHDGRPIYAAYDRAFGCSGHGWGNLQSCHINLPFADAEQFGRLHAAIRAVLPLLPALAASSPIVEGKVPGQLDARLGVYATNQRRVASIIGNVVPEPVFTPDDYQTQILAPMYRDVAPLDPDGVLQYEWLNSRGAIARFDRDAIEIRLLDVQETPLADLAIAMLVISAARSLTE
jgi:glutamate---cysteine ligase / carboxylate-amine ligase